MSCKVVYCEHCNMYGFPVDPLNDPVCGNCLAKPTRLYEKIPRDAIVFESAEEFEDFVTWFYEHAMNGTYWGETAVDLLAEFRARAKEAK